MVKILFRRRMPVGTRATSLHLPRKLTKRPDVAADPKNPNRAVLSVGNEEWPLPIPIVKKEGKWYFDTKVGLKEILYRRIGTNELDAITMPRLCGSSEGLRGTDPRRLWSESIRAEIYQYAWKTRWAGLAKSRWLLGRASRRGGSQEPC
jgi:hypothetical protein